MEVIFHVFKYFSAQKQTFNNVNGKSWLRQFARKSLTLYILFVDLRNRQSPLYAASSRGRIACVEALILANADVLQTNKFVA
jgi:hypothetical protein